MAMGELGGCAQVMEVCMGRRVFRVQWALIAAARLLLEDDGAEKVRSRRLDEPSLHKLVMDLTPERKVLIRFVPDMRCWYRRITHLVCIHRNQKYSANYFSAAIFRI
jgi:hypothetical protein